jgi:hypothetical protein
MPSKGVLPMAENNSIVALDRWEGEGGSDLPGWAARLPADDLAETERRVLIALGAAVVAEWNTLGSAVQRELFRHAAGEAPETAQLREQIARFLHDHKDDDTVA